MRNTLSICSDRGIIEGGLMHVISQNLWPRFLTDLRSATGTVVERQGSLVMPLSFMNGLNFSHAFHRDACLYIDAEIKAEKDSERGRIIFYPGCELVAELIEDLLRSSRNDLVLTSARRTCSVSSQIHFNGSSYGLTITVTLWVDLSASGTGGVIEIEQSPGGSA